MPKVGYAGPLNPRWREFVWRPAPVVDVPVLAKQDGGTWIGLKIRVRRRRECLR